jgi:hypothetical protein
VLVGVEIVAGAVVPAGAGVGAAVAPDVTGGGVTRTGADASAGGVSMLCANRGVAERARTATAAVMPWRSGEYSYLMRNQPRSASIGSVGSGGMRFSCGESKEGVENTVTLWGEALMPYRSMFEGGRGRSRRWNRLPRWQLRVDVSSSRKNRLGSVP